MRMQSLRDLILWRPRWINALLIIGSTLAALVFVEFSFRLIVRLAAPQLTAKIKNYVRVAASDNSASAYTPHPYLSYAPSDIVYENGGLRIRDRFFPKQKQPDCLRVACLGGSTTMRKYTVYLEKDLERYSLGRNFEVMDFGCNGWTLMESTIDYLIRIADFSPDVVLVHHGMNDVFPAIWPDFKPDYSHYRISWQDQSGWIDAKFLSRSWFFSYIQMQRGIRRTDLRNYTVRSINDGELSYKISPDTLAPYRDNLRNLVNVVRANGGKAVFAPMAYKRGAIAKKYGSLIEQMNECMRGVAEEMKVGLVETDLILSSCPDLFLDIVHVNKLGVRIQSLLYAPAIWDALQPSLVQPDEKEIVRTISSKKTPTAKRELEIRWKLDVQDASDFHVYVFDESAGAPVYLGRTGNGADRRLIWKANSPAIAKRFAAGPAIGRPYHFLIYAIPKEGKSPARGPFDQPDQIEIVEP